MWYWIIIIILGVAILFFLEVRHMKYRIYAVAIILLLLIFFVTFVNVIRTRDIDYKSSEGIFLAFKAYGSWIKNSASNLKVLTLNAIKMNWAPQNKSASEI